MKFFFDNNLGEFLVNGLKEFGQDVTHLKDHFPEHTPDIKWLEFIGKNEMVLITRDRMIRKRLGELQALKIHGVGAFFLGGKNMGHWDQVLQVIRAWHRIKEYADKTKPPYAFTVSLAGRKFNRIPID